MSDVAEVKEALAQYDDGEAGAHQVSALAAAARRWVRVVSEFPSDEQVEAAARAWCEANGHFFDSCAWSDQHLEHACAALVAAVGVEKDGDLDDYHDYQRRNEAPTVYSDPTPVSDGEVSGHTSRNSQTSQNREVSGNSEVSP